MAGKERIQLHLFWDDGRWAVEADDVDADGRHDSSDYTIEPYAEQMFAHLDRRLSYEAWGVRRAGNAVEVELVGEAVGEVDD